MILRSTSSGQNHATSRMQSQQTNLFGFLLHWLGLRCSTLEHHSITRVVISIRYVLYLQLLARCWGAKVYDQVCSPPPSPAPVYGLSGMRGNQSLGAPNKVYRVLPGRHIWTQQGIKERMKHKMHWFRNIDACLYKVQISKVEEISIQFCSIRVKYQINVRIKDRSKFNSVDGHWQWKM